MANKRDDARLAADLNPEGDPHARFRDLCLVYGDFHRQIFMQEILRFLEAAPESEVDAVREAAVRRARQHVRRKGRRGRPAALKDEKWLARARRVAWMRIVERRTWPAIARQLGIEPTKPNLRTIHRWLDGFAEVVAAALPPAPPAEDHSVWLERHLGRERLLLLRYKTGLPAHVAPEKCISIVLALHRRTCPDCAPSPRRK